MRNLESQLKNHKMLHWFKYYLFSGNKGVYRTIANEFGTGPVRVYSLAHGRKAKSNRDYQILKRLQRSGIIDGIIRA